MMKPKISNSESEESEREEKLSEEEEVNPKQKQQGISEYEKQRLSRIAENRARMEALGLSKMASSLMGSSQNSSKRKGKRKVVEDDEDYRPGDEDDNDDDVDDNDDKLDGDDDDDFPVKKTSQSRKNKVKNKVSKPKKAPIQKHLSSSDYVDDEDDELMKAIALSLQDSREVSGAGAVLTDVQDATFTERKGNARLKRKKLFTSRVQMTEDEMIVHFFQFDGAGKGSISMRDLRRVAIAHDFMWTDKELSDMIHCFDSGGDGKLNLDDFRKIVSRCNMLQSSENS